MEAMQSYRIKITCESVQMIPGIMGNNGEKPAEPQEFVVDAPNYGEALAKLGSHLARVDPDVRRVPDPSPNPGGIAPSVFAGDD